MTLRAQRARYLFEPTQAAFPLCGMFDAKKGSDDMDIKPVHHNHSVCLSSTVSWVAAYVSDATERQGT